MVCSSQAQLDDLQDYVFELLPDPYLRSIVFELLPDLVDLRESGSGVAGLSSFGAGFNQSGLDLMLGRCVVSVSSESEIFTSSGIGTLRIEELEAVLNLKHQNHVFSSCLDLNLVEEEEGLDRHVISYGTCPFQQRIHPSSTVP
ncbi:hypothetical protein Tco_1400813 [Tanacetum coccineum]